MISVTVTADQLTCSIDCDIPHYSADVVADLTQRAAVGIGQLLAQITATAEAMNVDDDGE